MFNPDGRRERGLAVYKEMGWGENESVKELDEDLWQFITDIGFGEVWSRPGLSLREREPRPPSWHHLRRNEGTRAAAHHLPRDAEGPVRNAQAQGRDGRRRVQGRAGEVILSYSKVSQVRMRWRIRFLLASLTEE